MNREQFEKWCYENKLNIFRYPDDWKDGGEYCDPFVKGAWYAYQEQQKIIAMQECGATEIKMILDDVEYDDATKISRIKELLK